MSSWRFANVLVLVDGSDGSRRAFDAALALCSATGATLTVLAEGARLPRYAALIAEVEDAQRINDRLASSLLVEAQAVASCAGVPIVTCAVANQGQSVQSIRRKANAHDLVVLAEGRGRVRSWGFHFATAKAARLGCPVMLVP